MLTFIHSVIKTYVVNNISCLSCNIAKIARFYFQKAFSIKKRMFHSVVFYNIKCVYSAFCIFFFLVCTIVYCRFLH